MPIIAKSGGTPRDPIPAGNHVARCYSLIEVGTVTKEWQGVKRQVYEIRIGFEFPDLMIEVDGEMKPMAIFLTRNLTLSKNARLRQELESWRGVPFTDEQLRGFDISKLIGVPAMLNVVHTEEGYDRVNAITPLPKSFNAPAQVNESQVLSYDEWNQTLFESLPEFLRVLVSSTPEYEAKFGKLPDAPAIAQPTGQGQPAPDHARVNKPVIEVREQAQETPPHPDDVEEPPF